MVGYGFWREARSGKVSCRETHRRRHFIAQLSDGCRVSSFKRVNVFEPIVNDYLPLSSNHVTRA